MQQNATFIDVICFILLFLPYCSFIIVQCCLVCNCYPLFICYDLNWIVLLLYWNKIMILTGYGVHITVVPS